MSLGRHEECLEIERQTPPEYFSSDLLCCSGVACWNLKRKEEAIVRLQRAATDPALKNVGFLTDPSTSTWKPLLFLARFHMELGKNDEAYQYARQAMIYLPAHPDIIFSWASLLAERGDPEESVKWLRELIAGKKDDGFKAKARGLMLDLGTRMDKPELILEAGSEDIDGMADAQVVYLRAGALGRLGRDQEQYDLLDAACAKFPNHIHIRVALSQVLESAGYQEQAMNIIAAGLDLPNPAPLLYERLAALLDTLGRTQDAENARLLARLAADPRAERPIPA